MQRHFYISHDLADLEKVETELERRGISTPQIHVLSNDDAGLERHHLNQVHSVLKRDVMHSYRIGAMLGIGVAAIILLTVELTGRT